MQKLIRDGKVAVLYSPGLGSGWYSWNDKIELLFDPVIVEWVLEAEAEEKKGNRNCREVLSRRVGDYVESKYPDDFVPTGGAYNLKVKWLPEGTAFYIKEYDGSESVIFGDKFITA